MIHPDTAKSIVSNLMRDGYNVERIAKKHGVSYSCVYSILTGRTWGFMTGDGSAFSSYRRTRIRVSSTEAEKVRSLHAGGIPQSEIARTLELSPACISRIVNYHTHSDARHR
jgi:Mor family transcriptional regulator